MVIKRHFIYNSFEVNIFAFKKTAEKQHSLSNILSAATCSDSNYLKKKTGGTTWTMAQLTSVSPKHLEKPRQELGLILFKKIL